MGQYGYLANSHSNRTRQAVLVIAYIIMAALAVSAAFAVAGEDTPQSWAAADQPEVVKFTSFGTGHATMVTLAPTENLEILTRDEVIAGLRIMRRMGARYLTDTSHHGQVSQRTITESLNEVLHHGGTWTAGELDMLNSVLKDTYPHITVF